MKYEYPFGAALAVLAIALAPGLAFAQSQMEVITPGGVLPSSVAGPMEPADRLAMNLRLLAQNPYDVNALAQAGESALAVGDANAAISFLARAEELSPANGRIKADLARALVQLERPAEAFRLFGEATTLGIPLQSIAKDRGLAFDLRGDPKRAQLDYTYALRTSPDDETVRRMALSLGISGDKDQALKQLEPLLRKRDQAAWRARSFILAMNGDLRGAEKIAEQVVPTGMMGGFSSFMRRLPALTASERAAAVNFGTMPSQEVRLASAPSATEFRPIDQGAVDVLTPHPAVTPAQSDVAANPRDRRTRGRHDQMAVRDASLASSPIPASQAKAAPAVAQVAPPQPASQVASQQPVPSWSDSRLTRRVGERLGPVDPSRLPPELAASPASAAAPNAAKLVLQPGVTQLPPPDAVKTASSAPNLPPRSVPVVPQASAVVLASSQAKPALFEVPKAISASPKAEVAGAVPPVNIAVTPAPAIVPASTPAIVRASVRPVEVALVPPAPVSVPVVSPAAPNSASADAAREAAGKTVPVPGFTDVAIVKPVLSEVVSPKSVPTLVAAENSVPLPAAPASAERSAATQQLLDVPARPTEVVGQPTPIAPPLPTAGPSLADAGLTQAVPTPPTMEVVQAAAPAPVATPLPSLPKPVQAGLGGLLSDIAVEQESRAGPVLTDTEFRRARLTAKRKAEAEERGDDAEAEKARLAAAEKTKLAADKAREEEEKRQIALRNPERVWVQVATGARRDGLPVTMKKLRDQAPDALKGVGSATVPFRATNRLLVGPFKSQSEARAMINKLAKQGIQATSFTSDAGQEVSRLSSRG